MIKNVLKFLAALLLVPCVISISMAFWDELHNIQRMTSGYSYILYGAAAYIICFILSFRMDYLYVFGHEVTHSIAVWLFGGKVKSFKVSNERGSVVADRSNIVISLLPYVLPMAAILVSLLYFLTALFYESKLLFEIFMFLIGFSFSMHILLTLDRARVSQTDFLHLGHLGSVLFIYVANLILVSLIFSFIFNGLSFKGFLVSFSGSTKGIYINLFRQLFV